MKKQLYKIICVDNFNRESVSDILIANDLTLQEAEQLMKEKYEKLHSERNINFYKIVPIEYKLFKKESLY